MGRRQKNQITQALAVSSFRRSLPKLASNLGIDLCKLTVIAERGSWSCAICLGPLVRPKVYFVGEYPRAVLCSYCTAAAKAADGDPLIALAQKRARWTTDRLRRFFSIHTTAGPFE